MKLFILCIKKNENVPPKTYRRYVLNIFLLMQIMKRLSLWAYLVSQPN